MEGFLKFFYNRVLVTSNFDLMKKKSFSIFSLADDVEKGDVDGFMKKLQSLIATLRVCLVLTRI